jgi:hypothetical protein
VLPDASFRHYGVSGVRIGEQGEGRDRPNCPQNKFSLPHQNASLKYINVVLETTTFTSMPVHTHRMWKRRIISGSFSAAKRGKNHGNLY